MTVLLAGCGNEVDAPPVPPAAPATSLLLGEWHRAKGNIRYVFEDGGTGVYISDWVSRMWDMEYSIDYSRDPHWLDINVEGKTTRAIATIRGDSMWLSTVAFPSPSSPRPSRHEESETDQVVWTHLYLRQK
jgi:hypothetical protein